jgi:hypothetical protein
LFFDGLHVTEEVLVTGSEHTEHSQVRRLQPGLKIAANIVAFLGNVGCDDDVLDTHFGRHAADVPAAEVGDHSPVIGVGNRAQTQLFDYEVQAVGAVAST